MIDAWFMFRAFQVEILYYFSPEIKYSKWSLGLFVSWRGRCSRKSSRGCQADYSDSAAVGERPASEHTEDHASIRHYASEAHFREVI